MSEFYSNKAFKLGIIGGILIYSVIYAYYSPPGHDFRCFDCYAVSGFPFTSSESGTIAHLDRTLWFGQIGNFLAAILFIFTVGLISNAVWSKKTPFHIDLN